MHCICVGVSAFIDTENIESTKKKNEFHPTYSTDCTVIMYYFSDHFFPINIICLITIIVIKF